MAESFEVPVKKTKYCEGCEQTKPKSAFSKNRKNFDGLQERCKACRKKATDKYYKKNKERLRNKQLFDNYGLSSDEYKGMLDGQGGVCAICGSPPGKRRLAVDHNHVTGDVRGLLCNRCNLALGQFQDSIGLLATAARYLYASK